MSEIKLGPWPLGMDMVSEETRLLSDDRGRAIAVRDAVNVDFNEAGQPARRRGYIQLDSAPIHSLWSCAAGTFCMRGNQLHRVHASASAASFELLATLASADAVSYDMLNGDVVFSSARSIGLITSAGVRELGVEEPSSFLLSAVAGGGLHAGRYSVVVTQVAPSGEESAASAMATVTVVDGGGLQLANLSHTLPLRAYRTEANGEVLYRCAEIPVGATEFMVGAGRLGRACETRNFARTPPGRIVRYWMGRLLIVRGRTIYFTESMRYGLVDPRRGFIQLPRRPTMVRPVDAGIFVGTEEGVRFYRGNSPAELREDMTGGRPPIPGTDVELDSGTLSGDASNGTRSAAWLSSNGYVLGTSGGQIIEPHSKRIRLSASSGSTAVNDRRLTTIVN